MKFYPMIDLVQAMLSGGVDAFASGLGFRV
jgi:ABC-type nitrate/sulfonate/bicarbonate transport system substrate-binding protein